MRHPRSIDDSLLFLMGEAARAEAGERGFDEPGFEQNASGVAVAIALAGHAKGQERFVGVAWRGTCAVAKSVSVKRFAINRGSANLGANKRRNRS